MDSSKAAYTTIDEYIAQFSPEIREILEKMRASIRAAAPEAEEKISYGMPAFFQNGVLVYFAACKEHIGFYPTGSGMSSFVDKVTEYKTSKGAIQFPLKKPIPYELVSEITKYRLVDNLRKAAEKSVAKKGGKS